MVQFNEAGTKCEKPEKCPSGFAIIAAVILIVLLASVACWYIHHPNRPRAGQQFDLKPGTQCVIRFRQDAFPERHSIGWLELYAPGTVIAVNRDAVLFEAVYENFTVNDVPQTERFWIPKSSILFIKLE